MNRSLTAAVLALTAVAVTHTVLCERRGQRDHAFASEGLRQRLALHDADHTEDSDESKRLVENSWLANVSVRHRAGLLNRRGLRSVARLIAATRPGAWQSCRGAHMDEARDRHDRRFIDELDAAHPKAT